MQIKILHLYYDFLNLYGEYGNVIIMKKHLEDQGYTVVIDKKTVGEEIDFSQYNFIYAGAGTESNLDYVLEDFRPRAVEFNRAIENKTICLMTGNSFEMLGKKVGKKEGLAIFDYETERIDDRISSDIIYKSQYFENKIVGFVNKKTEMYHNMSPLFEVEFGIGENQRNDFEGVKYINLYGTHVSGPILARNPEFLKKLVIDICKQTNKKFEYKEVEYPYEKDGYELVLNELEKRKSNK